MAALAALASRLIGADPFERDRIPHRLRQTLTNGFAVAAISIALDDLVGRRLGVPISALYGGALARSGPAVRGELRLGRPVLSTADAWVREAEALAERGFAAMKIRLGVLEQRDECRRRRGVPTARAGRILTFVADGNGGFNPTTARAMGRCLHELGLRLVRGAAAAVRGVRRLPRARPRPRDPDRGRRAQPDARRGARAARLPVAWTSSSPTRSRPAASAR